MNVQCSPIVPRETSVPGSMTHRMRLDLGGRTFGKIIADPPWRYKVWSEKGRGGKSPDAHYKTMPLDQIKELPVADYAHEDCGLLFWGVWPMVPQALEVIEAWGFRYLTGGSWAKRTRTGKLRVGPGYRLRSTCEPWFLAVRGDPPRLDRGVVNHIDALAREHSRKPDEIYTSADRLFFGPGLDLFGREPRDGWTVCGNEADKFGGRP